MNLILNTSNYDINLVFLFSIFIVFTVNSIALLFKVRGKEIWSLNALVLFFCFFNHYFLLDILGDFETLEAKRIAWYLGNSLFELVQLASIFLLRKLFKSKFILADIVFISGGVVMIAISLARYLDRFYFETDEMKFIYAAAVPAAYMLTFLFLLFPTLIKLAVEFFYKDIFNGRDDNHNGRSFAARIYYSICGGERVCSEKN